MKALASLVCAAALASGPVPAQAGVHMAFTPVRTSHGAGSHGDRVQGHNPYGPGLNNFGSGGAGLHGSGFAGDHFHRHFYGAVWFATPDLYADTTGYDVLPPAIEPPPPPPYWAYGPAPVAPMAPRALSSGPRIIYLDGKPARTGKEPVVIYGTYR